MRKMRKILILFLATITLQVSYGQQVWEQKYNDKVANTFAQTLANRYILAGAEYESMMQRWYIFQADSLGNMEWDTTFLHVSDGMPECIGATID